MAESKPTAAAIRAANKIILSKGIEFYEKNNDLMLLRAWGDDIWIFKKHPDGQWVSFKEANKEDIERILATSGYHLFESLRIAAIIDRETALPELVAVIPIPDEQGVTFDKYTWFSWDKLTGYHGPDDEDARKKFYETRIIARNIMKWREKLIAALAKVGGTK